MSSQTKGDAARLCSARTLRRILRELPGKKVTLMGLGVFGGGEGAARFLGESGARLTVTDLRPAHRLQRALNGLVGLPINYRLERHLPADFLEAELIVANPGVPRSSALLREAQQAGIPITSPMNIFLCLCPAPVVGVTGSNGKSTTTAMLAATLRSSGRKVWLGGNIGGSLLPELAQIGAGDSVVLELSSFQLADAGALKWSPSVAVVTNITPNHLDRHDTFEDYVAAKKNIARFQSDDNALVLNASCEVLRGWAAKGLGGQKVFFNARGTDGPEPTMRLEGQRLVWKCGGSDQIICTRGDIPLPGEHNVENAMAAAAAARWLGVKPPQIRQALRTFRPLEHRLEYLGEIKGMRFYNDSLSTSPCSSIAALTSFEAPITMIAGGYDKKLDLKPMARQIAASVEVLITMGQTGPYLAHCTREAALGLGRCPIVKEAQGLEEAVDSAVRLSMPGSTVLFSPGFASYDMFDNYAERGAGFKELVGRLSGGAAPAHRSA